MIDMPIAFCRTQMLAGNDYLLEQLGSIFAFDICTGFNGKVWLKAERVVDTILIVNALKQPVSKYKELQTQQPELVAKSSNAYQLPPMKELVDGIVGKLKEKK